VGALFPKFMSSRVYEQRPSDDSPVVTANQGGERAVPAQLQSQITPNGTAAKNVPVEEDSDGSKSTDKRDINPSTETRGGIEESQQPKKNGLSDTEGLSEDTVVGAASGSQGRTNEATVNERKEGTSRDDQVISSTGTGHRDSGPQ
jgi:hypothetical protein